MKATLSYRPFPLGRMAGVLGYVVVVGEGKETSLTAVLQAIAKGPKSNFVRFIVRKDAKFDEAPVVFKALLESRMHVSVDVDISFSMPDWFTLPIYRIARMRKGSYLTVPVQELWYYLAEAGQGDPEYFRMDITQCAFYLELDGGLSAPDIWLFLSNTKYSWGLLDPHIGLEKSLL